MMRIEKNSVQETLMLPLFGKAEATRKWPQYFHDEDAARVMSQVDYDFSTLESKSKSTTGKIGVLSAAYRQLALATEARRYLESRPEATIVNLGCGLDTTGHQADNGKCRFVNIDLPNVIEIREQLLPSNDREKNVACDLTDRSWFDMIGFDEEKGAFFFASGVFMYFKKDDVKNLICDMSKRFPGASISFDGQNRKGADVSLKTLKASGIDISTNFCLEEPKKEMESWGGRFESVRTNGMIFPYLDPKPFGFLFKHLARNADDSGMSQIDTIVFMG